MASFTGLNAIAPIDRFGVSNHGLTGCEASGHCRIKGVAQANFHWRQLGAAVLHGENAGTGLAGKQGTDGDNEGVGIFLNDDLRIHAEAIAQGYGGIG
jgi:hypothetical protein